MRVALDQRVDAAIYLLRNLRLLIGEELVDAILFADQINEAGIIEQRERIAKLKERDRDLLNRRYTPGITIKQVAEQLGRPAKSVYAALGRIRHALLECVERKLAAEGRP